VERIGEEHVHHPRCANLREHSWVWEENILYLVGVRCVQSDFTSAVEFNLFGRFEDGGILMKWLTRRNHDLLEILERSIPRVLVVLVVVLGHCAKTAY
jgi:hypothetical protein